MKISYINFWLYNFYKSIFKNMNINNGLSILNYKIVYKINLMDNMTK